MPRKRSLVPSYRLHKPSGNAVVRLNGKDIYLGKHGTEESRERYSALIADHLTIGAERGQMDDGARGPTVDELVAAYWTYLETEGRYMKRGQETSERGWIRDSLRPLSEGFGSLRAEEFGPRRLQAFRTLMVERSRVNGRSLSRTTVNGRVRRVVRVFRWGASMELVSGSVWQALASVPGLRRGESSQVAENAKVQPVPESVMRATLPFLSNVVAAMVELQWLTGMRPGEVCSITARDIDRTEDIWVYRPERHKTEHHGLSCERLLGPRAQAILQPRLARHPDALLFSPGDALRERREGADASAPPWPRATSAVEPCYSTHSYRRAIHRACDRAGVERWSPNQLRHSRATEVRRRFGLEAAQVALGHASADVTQVYAERDRELAARVARETG
ncbi:MAG: tyrosine-type recombinase/integrase [Planctomycetota bacterium]